MDNHNSEKSTKRYTLKPTSIPLKPKEEKPVIRAINEDDDLYDPYSDYHDGTLKDMKFEEDPWR